jgi:hypothetical protein
MKLLFTEKHIVRIAGDLCHNENTHLAISRNTDEDDDI